jgi:hypothetical protein
MKRLKVWHRIAILFLVMLAVNIISLAIVNRDKNLAIKTIEKERDGLVYLEPCVSYANCCPSTAAPPSRIQSFWIPRRTRRWL